MWSPFGSVSVRGLHTHACHCDVQLATRYMDEESNVCINASYRITDQSKLTVHCNFLCTITGVINVYTSPPPPPFHSPGEEAMKPKNNMSTRNLNFWILKTFTRCERGECHAPFSHVIMVLILHFSLFKLQAVCSLCTDEQRFMLLQNSQWLHHIRVLGSHCVLLIQCINCLRKGICPLI